MKKIFTFLAALMLCGIFSAGAEEVKFYLTESVYEGTAPKYYSFTSEMVRNSDGSYTIENFFDSDQPLSFKFDSSKVGSYTQIELTSPTEEDGGDYYLLGSTGNFKDDYIELMACVKSDNEWIYLNYPCVYGDDEYTYLYVYDPEDEEKPSDYMACISLFATDDDGEYRYFDVEFWFDEIPVPVEPVFSIRGEIFTGEWADHAMTKTDDGKWVVENADAIPGGFCIFSTVEGEDAQTWYHAAEGEGDVVLDKALTLADTQTNWNVKYGTYTFTIDPANMTLTVTGEEKTEPTPEIVYMLRGHVKGNNDWGNVPLTEEDGKWSATLEEPLVEFGIMQANAALMNKQIAWYAGSAENFAIKEAGEYDVVGEASKNFTCNLEGPLTLTFDPEAMTLTVAGVGGEEPEPAPFVEWEAYYLTGGFNNWPPKGVAFEAAADGSGIYTVTVPYISGEFKINDGTWNNSVGGSDNKLVAGEPYQTVLGTMNNIMIDLPDGKEYQDATITFDPNTGIVTLTGTEADTPKAVYVIHGTDGTDWKDYPMTEDEGKWTLDPEVLITEFGIKEMLRGNQNAWIASADASPAIEKLGTYNAKVNGNNWKLDIEDIPLYIFDPESMTLTIEKGTGVAAIATEEGEVEYFNLQGIKVANPENGIFIRRQGNKVQKVVK